MGEIGDARAIRPLVNTIENDFEKEVRFEAAKALCEIKNEPGNDEESVRFWIAWEGHDKMVLFTCICFEICF